jgi:hypothetical protein
MEALDNLDHGRCQLVDEMRLGNNWLETKEIWLPMQLYLWPKDSESHDAPQNIWHKSLFRSWICTAFRFIQFVPKKLRLGLGSRLRHSKDL